MQAVRSNAAKQYGSIASARYMAAKACKLRQVAQSAHLEAAITIMHLQNVAH